MILAGLLNAAEDKDLVRTLADRGITTDAVVTHVGKGPRGGVASVVVQFNVNGQSIDEELGIIDAVPRRISEGERVEVTYDPRDPSRVLLPTQVNRVHVIADYVVAGLGAAAAVGGLGWWLTRRPQRQSRPPRHRR